MWWAARRKGSGSGRKGFPLWCRWQRNQPRFVSANGLCSQGHLEPDTNPLGLCCTGALIKAVSQYLGCVRMGGLWNEVWPLSGYVLPPPPSSVLSLSLSLSLRLHSVVVFARLIMGTILLMRMTRHSHDGCDRNMGHIEPFTSASEANSTIVLGLTADSYTSWIKKRKCTVTKT